MLCRKLRKQGLVVEDWVFQQSPQKVQSKLSTLMGTRVPTDQANTGIHTDYLGEFFLFKNCWGFNCSTQRFLSMLIT